MRMIHRQTPCWFLLLSWVVVFIAKSTTYATSADEGKETFAVRRGEEQGANSDSSKLPHAQLRAPSKSEGDTNKSGSVGSENSDGIADAAAVTVEERVTNTPGEDGAASDQNDGRERSVVTGENARELLFVCGSQCMGDHECPSDRSPCTKCANMNAWGYGTCDYPDGVGACSTCTTNWDCTQTNDACDFCSQQTFPGQCVPSDYKCNAVCNLNSDCDGECAVCDIRSRRCQESRGCGSQCFLGSGGCSGTCSECTYSSAAGFYICTEPPAVRYCQFNTDCYIGSKTHCSNSFRRQCVERDYQCSDWCSVDWECDGLCNTCVSNRCQAMPNIAQHRGCGGTCSSHNDCTGTCSFCGSSQNGLICMEPPTVRSESCDYCGRPGTSNTCISNGDCGGSCYQCHRASGRCYNPEYGIEKASCAMSCNTDTECGGDCYRCDSNTKRCVQPGVSDDQRTCGQECLNDDECCGSCIKCNLQGPGVSGTCYRP